MSTVEQFIFDRLKLNGAAPFLQAFTLNDRTISVEIVSYPGRASRVISVFTNAIVESLSFDTDESLDWPIDIIGFDSYEAGERWRFVLFCTEAEWSWVSDWPVIAESQSRV
jgi:hypothetical protein